jgi:hypothetical protein
MANQKVAARLQVGPNCLLFFIDETGHETFADKNYPVFGLGGCAINSSSAAAVIAEPWRAMTRIIRSPGHERRLQAFF